MPDTPMLAFPLRVVEGRFLEVEQGEAEDVVGQITALVHTPPGWLGTHEDDPARDFGLASQEHLAGGADASEVQAQLDEWIEDADIAVTARLDEVNAALSVVGVRIGV